MEKVATISMRLQELKDIYGLRNVDISEICNISKTNITKYIKGDYEPKIDVINALANHFHISTGWLQGFDVPMVDPTIMRFNNDEYQVVDTSSPDTWTAIKVFDTLTDTERTQALNMLRVMFPDKFTK